MKKKSKKRPSRSEDQKRVCRHFEARYRPIKEELLRSSGHTQEFIDSHHGYCRTNDEWYPNFKGWHYQYVAFYVVPADAAAPMTIGKPFARFMGADDTDMGRGWEREDEMFDFFDHLPQVVNKDYLESQGFTHGY